MTDSARLVYGLVSGEYSDYGVHAIFSSYEAAAREADRLNTLSRMDRPRSFDNECEVQPFMLDPTPAQLTAEGGAEVHIDDCGNVVEFDHWRRRYPINPFAAPYDYIKWSPAAKPARRFVGFGVDDERARRAADEYRCLVLMYENAPSSGGDDAKPEPSR